MFKVMYWSKKKNKLVVVIIFDYEQLLWYLAEYEDDFDITDHFLKIVKE